jgi:hypothetical protein
MRIILITLAVIDIVAALKMLDSFWPAGLPEEESDK